LLFAVAIALLVAEDSQPASAESDVFSILEEEEAVVSSVTKSATRISEAPAIVSIVTQEQITEYGYQSVAEVLKHVPGFYILDDHILPNVAVRGISGGLFAESSIIKLMIDGHAINYRWTSGNWLGPELIPMSAIERIEIIRGPASALYGADAFLGVVNVITKKGASIAGARVKGGAGVVGKNLGYDGDFALGGKRGDWDVLLAGRVNSEDRSGLALPASSPAPNVPSYRNGDLNARGLVSASRVGFFKLSKDFANRGSLQLRGHIASIERGGEFAPWAQMVNGYDSQGHFNETHISLFQGSLMLDGKLAITPTLDLSLATRFFKGGPAGNDQIDVGDPLYYVKRRQGYQGTDSTLELQWRPLVNLTGVLGSGFMYDDEQLQSVEQISKFAVGGYQPNQVVNTYGPAQSHKALINAGAYAQLMYSPFERYLSLLGGFRYDYHNIYGSQASGRVGAVSSPL
jgi:outer membrane receptor protein involved in Fe transport